MVRCRQLWAGAGSCSRGPGHLLFPRAVGQQRRAHHPRVGQVGQADHVVEPARSQGKHIWLELQHVPVAKPSSLRSGLMEEIIRPGRPRRGAALLIVPVRLARQVRTAHDHGSEARRRGRVAHGPRNLRAAVRRVRTATAVEQVHQARPRRWRSAIRSTWQSPLPKLVAANDRGHVRGCERNEHQQRARRRRGQRRARGRARSTRARREHAGERTRGKCADARPQAALRIHYVTKK